VVLLVGSMLLHALAPTEAEVQQSQARLRQLAAKSEGMLLDACTHHFDEVVEMLAISAFAPGGSELALSETRLAFDASVIGVELVSRLLL